MFTSSQEIWLPVPISRFCNYYEVSIYGRVRSHDRIVIEKNGKQRHHKGRLITPKRSGKYLGVSLFHEGSEHRYYIHRLVAEAFIPNPQNKPCVNHINFNRHDNTAKNLEWVTYAENTNHLFCSGRYTPPEYKRGEDTSTAKLTDESVRHLRLNWKPGMSTRELQAKYGVSMPAIYKALRGKSWLHVEPSVAVHWPRKNGD